MKEIILVFFGSGFGGALRFGIGKWVNTLHNYHFPFGTLIVNIIACFVVGLLIGLADYKQLLTAQIKLFWMIGFCGGFSTFSAFSGETILLFQHGQYLSSIVYVLSSVLLCLAATLGGIMMMEKI